MKLIRAYTALVMTSGLLTFSCVNTGKNNELKADHIYGKWTCRIVDGEYIGIDTLYFRNDMKFNDSQNLTYKSSDSGFDFISRFNHTISGIWRLASDSIFIRYDIDSFIFNFESNSFSVSASSQGADTIVMKDLRRDMQEDLSRYLNATLRDRYKAISGKDMFMGKVMYLDPDSMVVSNNGLTLTLRRVINARTPILSSDGH